MLPRVLKSDGRNVDDQTCRKIVIFLSIFRRRDTFCGTIRYIPPELLKGESYSYEIDMWNIGVILYELVSGMNPVTTDSLANL